MSERFAKIFDGEPEKFAVGGTHIAYRTAGSGPLEIATPPQARGLGCNQSARDPNTHRSKDQSSGIQPRIRILLHLCRCIAGNSK